MQIFERHFQLNYSVGIHDGFTLFCLMICTQTVSLIQFSAASRAILNQERLVLQFPIELGARPLSSVGIPNSGADTGFFLGRGALISCSTSTPINHIVFFWQNTSCIRKPQVISGGGCENLNMY